MAENSKIEWTDHTVNLWWGCAKVHTGCKNCYAEGISNRFGNNIWGEKAQRKLVNSATENLNKYQRRAEKENKIVKVFIGSMMDVFEDPKSIIGMQEQDVNTGTLRDQLFAEIAKGKYQNLVFLFLTKRPENIVRFIPKKWVSNTPNNVWFGTSVSNQETIKYAESLRLLSNSNLFLSIEPQVGLIDKINLKGIDWVIQGGESGNNKRPFDINWAYRMKQICKDQKTPFFFKQIDKVQSIPEDVLIREFPNFGSVGKKVWN
jgi:protein gp37